MSTLHDPLWLSWSAYGANCPVDYEAKAILHSSSTLIDGISILMKMDWIQDVVVPISDHADHTVSVQAKLNIS